VRVGTSFKLKLREPLIAKSVRLFFGSRKGKIGGKIHLEAGI